MQCRAPAGGWRRPAPSEKRGGGGSSAGRGRELPARRRGRGRPPRTVASRCRRPARLLPAAQSASSEASAGGGEGAAAARVLARCLPGGGARAAGARRARAVPARSRALSPRLPSPGGRTRPPARGQDKERGGDPAGWPLTPLAAEPVYRRRQGRGRRLAGPLCRGVASGLSPPPERGCPLDYPPPQAGARVIPGAGRISSPYTRASVVHGAPTPGQGPGSRGRESPAALEDWRLMGVVDEARHAGGGKLPLAPRVS